VCKIIIAEIMQEYCHCDEKLTHLLYGFVSYHQTMSVPVVR